MDRIQIGLKLALDYLGIPCIPENYQQITDICYLAEQRGLCLFSNPTGVLWSKHHHCACSPYSHEDGGYPSWNLLEDINEIEKEIKGGFDESQNFKLDEESIKSLEKIRKDLKTKTVAQLVEIVEAA